jgi:general secretion pathway protein C
MTLPTFALRRTSLPGPSAQPTLAHPVAPRLASIALFAVLCATLTWWGITLRDTASAPPDVAPAARTLPDSGAAANLLGGHSELAVGRQLHLVGLLSFQGGGTAAIIGIGDAPPRAVGLNAVLGSFGTLAEVRARSVVVDLHGVRSEVFLPANVGGPTIYMH